MGTSKTWYQNKYIRGVTFLRWWQLGIKQEVLCHQQAVALGTEHGKTCPWIPTLHHENVYRSAWLQCASDYITAPRWWWHVTMAQPDNGCSFLISEQGTTGCTWLMIWAAHLRHAHRCNDKVQPTFIFELSIETYRYHGTALWRQKRV